MLIERLGPLPTITCQRGKHTLGHFGYWGGLESRTDGGAVGVGLDIDKGLFWSSFPCLSCGLQRIASV
jgi:hypothetical protein